MSAFNDPYTIAATTGNFAPTTGTYQSNPSNGALSGASTGAGMGSMFGSIGSGIGAAAGGIMGLFQKKKKAPTPPTGAQLGQSALDYYNTAFPGTTPWERLGTSNPAGGVASSSMETQTQTNNANSERSFQHRQLALDTFSRLLDLKIKQNQVDIGREDVKIRQQEANTRQGHLGLEKEKTPADIHQKKWGHFSGLKSLYDEHPWITTGLLGLTGAVGMGLKGAQALRALKTIPALKQGEKLWGNLKDAQKIPSKQKDIHSKTPGYDPKKKYGNTGKDYYYKLRQDMEK